MELRPRGYYLAPPAEEALGPLHGPWPQREWIADLGLPPATRNTVLRAGYRTPDQLRLATDAQLLAVRNLGRRSLAAIRQAVGPHTRSTE